MMGRNSGSMPRHRQFMMNGVPEPYASRSNPLPKTPETLAHGAAVYTKNCASCHGATGRGDGEGGRSLSPPSANLAWLSQMPMMRSDAFLYWAIAEGGVPFETAMPAFKDVLAPNDLWAVIAYIQAGLPPVEPKPSK